MARQELRSSEYGSNSSEYEDNPRFSVHSSTDEPETSQAVANLDLSFKRKPSEESICEGRSPADLLDIISDIVDDLGQLSGLATFISPFTDADPQVDCIKGTMINFLRNDLKEFLNEANNECDICVDPTSCQQEPESQIVEEEKVDVVEVSEPEEDLNLNEEEEEEVAVEEEKEPQVYVPVPFSKNILEPRRKPKIKSFDDTPPKKPKKEGCCAKCTIV